VERLFLALWPDDAVRTALAGLTADVSAGRVVAAVNLHLTLVFLGAVDAGRRACIETICAGMRAPIFELLLTDVRWRSRAGIVWAAPAQAPDALCRLAVDLNAGLKTCGVVPETRPLRAHVTLARDVRRRPALALAKPIRWTVSEFCLVSSHLGRGGSRYIVERAWRLT